VQGNFSQGSLATSPNVLDLAIDGNGFFIVRDSQGGTFYSRAGLFRLDRNNNVVDPTGFKLQGFMADTTGTIIGTIGDIALPSTTAPPRATTTVSVAANLNSATPVRNFDLSNPPATSSFSTSMTVFDSLGNSRLLTTYFTKIGANRWNYNVVASLSDVVRANYHTDNINPTLGIVRVGSGTLTFGTDGRLDRESPVTRFNTGTAAGTRGTVPGELQIDFNGATPNQPIVMEFGRSVTTDRGTGLDGTTQFGSPSALVQQTQDGFAAGSLQAFSVDANGTISGRFSNGQVRALAQVALARFPDPIGLVRTGKNTFAQSGNSGQPVTGMPDSAGLGRVLSNSLELSNVDLGESFVDMIAAQRGFQANARVITTSDEILLELVNLRR
jgi:flagellar hook protein FlgE